MSKDSKLLIILSTIRRIIDIFLGPFLTAYFFKTSIDNIKTISLYNIYAFLIMIIVAFIVGIIIKKNNEIKIFRIGMIMRFVQLFIIVLLGKKIIKYLWLVAIISGISTMTWAFPLNILSSLIPNKEKDNYIVYKTILTNIINVLIPTIFGTLISIKSFEKVAIISLILSIIQIILSFNLKEHHSKTYEFNIFNVFSRLIKNNNIKELFISNFYLGLTSEGALDTIITLMIIITFHEDYNLGIISSLGAVLSIISAYMYKKIKNMKKTIYIFSILPLISSIILMFIINRYTVITHNIIYTFTIQIIVMLKSIITLKISNSEIINDENRVESYVLYELFLGLGRVLSYIMLLVIALIKKTELLTPIMAILTLFILFMSSSIMKIKNID